MVAETQGGQLVNIEVNVNATYGYDVVLDFPECPNPTDERPACRTGGPIANDYDPKFAVWETLDPWAENEISVFSARVMKDDIFGIGDLTYAGSYQKYDHASLDNWSRNDANDLFRTWIINDDGYDRYTHELRLQSNGDGPLQWTVGAYFDEVDWKQTPNGQWQYHASDNRSRAIAEYLKRERAYVEAAGAELAALAPFRKTEDRD